ncbi:MAG TPA: hypothetical protein VLC91_11515 [Spongiibacteraceae bacterium]|nr:hypothetical protein [Spongiibacteraceae bacterium]
MSILNDQARDAAKAVGVVLVRFQHGFYLFSAEDGEQLGLPELMHQPWSARDVLEYCAMFMEGMETGSFVVQIQN